MRLLQRTLDHGSLEKLFQSRRLQLPPATQAHSKPSAGNLAKAEGEDDGQRSKVFLQGLNYDISQALPWLNHALSTLETGSMVTLGQKQLGWPLGRMWKKWSEAKSRRGGWRRHRLCKSIRVPGRVECEAKESSFSGGSERRIVYNRAVRPPWRPR